MRHLTFSHLTARKETAVALLPLRHARTSSVACTSCLGLGAIALARPLDAKPARSSTDLELVGVAGMRVTLLPRALDEFHASKPPEPEHPMLAQRGSRKWSKCSCRSPY
jgi:hypothetical protein